MLGACGTAPKISTFSGERSMAQALAIALFLTTVDREPAISAQTLMEAQYREALHHSDKLTGCPPLKYWPSAREEVIRGQC